MMGNSYLILAVNLFIACRLGVAFGNLSTVNISASPSMNSTIQATSQNSQATVMDTITTTSATTTPSHVSASTSATVASQSMTPSTTSSSLQPTDTTSATTSQTVQIIPSSTQGSTPSSAVQAGPVHGKWNTWSSWSTCTKSCDNGTQFRTRACTNPSPQNNGNNCTGNDREIQHCNTGNCPVRAFSVSMKFTNEPYDAQLADKASPKYNNLKHKLETATTATFANDPTYQRMENLTFTQGSVIAAYVLVFGPSNSSSAQDPSVVLEQVVSSGSFAGLHVDKASFTITESAQGTTLTVWVTDVLFCESRCCVGTPGHIWQNRTCTEGSSSCAGILTVREVKCEYTKCGEEHCKSNAVSRTAGLPLTLITAVLYLLLYV